MSTDLARLDGARALVAALTPGQWEVARRQIAGSITDDEMALVMARCRAVGLNPLLGQIHISVRTDKSGVRKLVFVTSIHTLVARAAALPGWEGVSAAAVHRNDAFRRDAVTGEVHHAHGSTDRGPLLGAWAMCSYRGERRASKWLPTEEYRPGMQSMPDLMIEKTATAMVIRLARGDLLGDVYAAEEFGGQSREDGTVAMPRERPADALPAPEDTDAETIVPAVLAIEAVPDLEALDAALVSIRAEATGWTPNQRRLFASHVARRREALSAPVESSGPAAEEASGG